jgi:hypothetical protein
MRLLRNVELLGYTQTQNSQRGWKEINCSKEMNSGYSTVNTVSLTVANGNPEFYFIVYWEYFLAVSNAAVHFARADAYGYGFNTSGGLITHPAMAAFNYYFWGWNGSGIISPSNNNSTRVLNFTSRTTDYGSVRHVHQLYVFSERIDLITLTCV